MAEAAEDKPKTSGEEIEEGKRRRKRDVEERCSFLEDENQTLKGALSDLQKQWKELSDSLKTKPASNGKDKSLWDELENFFDW